MKRTKNKKNQKGESLLFTILVMSFIMGISLTVSYVLLQEMRMTREMGNSVVAFYAAESGVEESMMSENVSGQGFLNGDISYKFEKTVGGESSCQAENFCVQSTGTYKDTNRSIRLQN